MGPLHHHFTSSCPHSVGLAHWAPGHAHLKIFAFPGFFFLEYSSPDGAGPPPSSGVLRGCLLREALPFPPHHPYSFHQPSLCVFPHRGMTIWHPVYYTHSGFYLWSFPLKCGSTGGVDFSFSVPTVFRVQGRSWYTAGAQYIFLNEWMKFHFSYSKGNGGWTGGGKWKAANPDGLHTQSLETSAEASGEKDIFQDRRKSQPTVVFEFAQASGEGFLEEFFCLWVELMPKVQFLGWWGVLPTAGCNWSRDSQAHPAPEVGGAGSSSADSNPSGLKSSRLPAEESSLQLLMWGRGKPVSLISYGKLWAVFQLEPRIPGSFPSPSLQTVPHCNCASLGETISTVTLSPNR